MSPEISSGAGRILLIDDDEMVLDATSRLIQSLGYEVNPLSSAKEAIITLKEEGSYYDLIISDQTMPEMSGKELADYLWSIGSKIPFLLCSGNSTDIGSSEGILKVLSKPVSRSDFSSEINQVLNIPGDRI